MKALQPGLALLCLLLTAVCTDCQSWSLSVPHKISALQGSCVVVPCEVTYPGEAKSADEVTTIWYKNSDTMFSSKEQVDRWKQIGDIELRNCTLEIDQVRNTDAGRLHFRIEVKNLNSYSFKENLVTVELVDDPQEPKLNSPRDVKAGDRIFASCEALHSCPSHPPQFTWRNTKGLSHAQHQKLENGEWKSSSTLEFTPAIQDNDKKLTCMVEHRGGKIKESFVLLNVKYQPRIQNSSSCSVDTTTVSCQCHVDSNPESQITWRVRNREMGANITYQKGTTTVGTLQAAFPLSRNVLCLATNSYGKDEKSFLLPLHEKPEIHNDSRCAINATGLFCICFVNSTPPVDIQWQLPGASLSSSITKKQGDMTTAILMDPITSSQSISCLAVNDYGTASMTFTVPKYEKPEIHNDSRCAINATGLFCICFVNSTPPVDIQWQLSGTNLSSSITTKQGDMTTAILMDPITSSQSISCLAVNDYGRASMTFTVPKDDLMWYLFIALPSAAVLLIVVLVVVVCRRRAGKNTAEKNINYVNKKTSVDSEDYRNGEKSRYTSWEINEHQTSYDQDIYCNEHPVYGNTEELQEMPHEYSRSSTVEAEDIYANM
ncbi:myelin-associated glycoprotein-like isoform X1 [Erpetoichthys calabaricus]|uniref:myelin-associated glycoprotein-like isoform X1 n=1 Tax=Erpetoichthys calabaricus TaxID=27687 RepID=UPI0022344F2A|nr:myelin-associated glycoprotein-like isoform X1 [Erpetoichthys calabaricus]